MAVNILIRTIKRPVELAWSEQQVLFLIWTFHLCNTSLINTFSSSNSMYCTVKKKLQYGTIYVMGCSSIMLKGKKAATSMFPQTRRRKRDKHTVFQQREITELFFSVNAIMLRQVFHFQKDCSEVIYSNLCIKKLVNINCLRCLPNCQKTSDRLRSQNCKRKT